MGKSDVKFKDMASMVFHGMFAVIWVLLLPGIIIFDINVVINVVSVTIIGLNTAEEFTPPSNVTNVKSVGNIASITFFIEVIVLVVKDITEPISTITINIIAL